jgi:hypothetical protein
VSASAYLDTVLVSGLVNRDIAPVELQALIEILSRYTRAELSLVCSEAVGDELAAIPSDYRGPHLAQLKVFGSIPRVKPGGITRLSVVGVSGANPYRAPWDRLRALLPDLADAEHVFVASSNRVKVLITVDRRTMLNRRSEVRALCGVELMRPAEFLHAVSSGS